jgi:hypothetical protein
MSVSGVAQAMVGAQASDTQMSLAAIMLKMNASAAGAMADLLDKASQNIDSQNPGSQNLHSLANLAAGVGQNVNIST